MVELAKLTVEQPSPVSVLDAFYVEDTPSPVKKKPSAFNGTYTSLIIIIYGTRTIFLITLTN